MQLEAGSPSSEKSEKGANSSEKVPSVWAGGRGQSVARTRAETTGPGARGRLAREEVQERREKMLGRLACAHLRAGSRPCKQHEAWHLEGVHGACGIHEGQGAWTLCREPEGVT